MSGLSWTLLSLALLLVLASWLLPRGPWDGKGPY